MNQEREERTIRELFEQLRRDDELSAPPFAAGLEGARSGRERADRYRFVQPTAVTIVVLLLLGGVWLSFPKQSAKTQPPIDVGNFETPAPNIESLPTPETTPPSVANRPMKSDRHRQKLVRPRPAALLVSQWRSPTVSLLRLPGEQLLKTVPQLDESLIEIRPLAPSRQRDQKN